MTTNERAAGLFWRTVGTSSTGQPITYDGVSLLVFAEDGKIDHFASYYDTRQLCQTLGAP